MCRKEAMRQSKRVIYSLSLGTGDAEGDGAGAGGAGVSLFLLLTIQTIIPMMMLTSTTANRPSAILVRTSRFAMPATTKQEDKRGEEKPFSRAVSVSRTSSVVSTHFSESSWPHQGCR